MKIECGNCRFWGRSDEAHLEFRSCLGIVHDKSGVTNPDLDDPSDPQELQARLNCRQHIPAVVVDGSGYHAALRCKSDFGCVMFKPKA